MYKLLKGTVFRYLLLMSLYRKLFEKSLHPPAKDFVADYFLSHPHQKIYASFIGSPLQSSKDKDKNRTRQNKKRQDKVVEHNIT
jgi:hypothetical protein